MSYGIVEIFDRQFKQPSVFIPSVSIPNVFIPNVSGSSASSIAALSGYFRTRSNISEAAGKWPPARTPDNPSSTR
jgi:hypothetical protein